MSPIAVLDAHYGASAAAAAAVLLDGWRAEVPFAQHRVTLDAAAPYVPGRFKDRELPALLRLLAEVKFFNGLLIIDAYCTLDPSGAPGLGAYLFDALGLPVVGVAKNRFQRATHAQEILRGGSRRPLFVTACGLDPAEAAQRVREMAGPHRLPDAIKAVDRLARDG